MKGGYAWRRRPARLQDMTKPELVVLVRQLELLCHHQEEALYDKRIADLYDKGARLRGAEVQRQAKQVLRHLPRDPDAARHRLDLDRALVAPNPGA